LVQLIKKVSTKTCLKYIKHDTQLTKLKLYIQQTTNTVNHTEINNCTDNSPLATEHSKTDKICQQQ